MKNPNKARFPCLASLGSNPTILVVAKLEMWINDSLRLSPIRIPKEIKLNYYNTPIKNIEMNFAKSKFCYKTYE
jgi:hypothetical protein